MTKKRDLVIKAIQTSSVAHGNCREGESPLMILAYAQGQKWPEADKMKKDVQSFEGAVSNKDVKLTARGEQIALHGELRPVMSAARTR